MDQSARPILLLSENPLEQIDIYLSTWESSNAAQSLVSERARRRSIAIEADRVEAKGRGVAYCLRNAREFFTSRTSDATGPILTAYYGLMSFLSACLIADPASDYDLGTLEKATKVGHGLGSVDSEDGTFPEAQKVYIRDAGFFSHYLRHNGIDFRPLGFSRPLKDTRGLPPDERRKLISFQELLARVPELSTLYYEVTGKPPLNVHVFGSGRNADELSERRMAAYNSKGIDAIRDMQMSATWVGFRSPAQLTGEFIERELCIPLQDVSPYQSSTDTEQYWHGRTELKKGPYIWQNLATYKSAQCPSSWVKPVLGIVGDQLAVHFMLLYLLSIFVRYRPSLWREVTEGGLHDYSVLIRLYMATIRRVVPELVLERITERPVQAIQPGSWDAPM